MQPVCAACCGGGRWHVSVCESVCDYVFGPVSVHDVLKQPPQKDDRVTCFPTNPPVYNGVYFQTEGVFEGSLRSLPRTLFISFSFYHRTMLPLNIPTYLALALALSPRALLIMW